MKAFLKRLFPSWHSISQRLKEIVLLFQTQKIYGNRSVKKNLQLISESEYFDAQWYLQRYQDIAQSQINPALHYLLYGGFEGRNPSNSFSSALYTKTHPEIIETRINPLIHFLCHKPNQNAKTPLYLHVGLHKTGTSAIQKFLRHHADCLQE